MKKNLRCFKFRPLMIIIALLAVTVFVVTASADPSIYFLATFTPCLGVVTANLATDCDNPRVSGYEDVALLFNRSDIDWSAVTTDASNPRIVKSIAPLNGKKPYVIYNPRVNPAPFNGTNSTFEQEANQYTKTVQFYYEGIGGAASMNIVEPLKAGSYVVLLQRKDHRGDGSFQLIGFQAGVTATKQVQDEETGYWLITMTGSESFADVSFFDTDYATSKSAFDTLLATV